ncbi:MAG: hypothetical protein FKY71_16205 [Spiribacter salinus]|uniref:Uncharacterized protein n=1 Tax=Spiribacter salinus TaxID=1335746 RepID=A0A540VKK2_9GAMM|nr:MAG: hypothetical protein FKY71_16205 [Spiribacter salinus]
MDRIAPMPDGSAAVAALDAALNPWMEGPDNAPALVLTPCYHGAPAISRLWAEARGWTVVDPLSRSHIMQSAAAAEDWLSARMDSTSPWVLPRLERCYVRTPRGLAFIRRLLNRWAAGALGRGLMGCDPHAWVFLRQVWQGKISHQLALQPFSAEMLGQWLRTLAGMNQSDEAVPISFRVAGGGPPVLPDPREGAPGAAPRSDNGFTSPYLRMLAGFSQGHPGIARVLWRRSLLVPPDAPPPTTEEPPDPESEAKQILWVRPWKEVDRPHLPSDVAQPVAFVLHALLLHGGLSADQLCPLLPSDAYAVRHRLQGLRDAEIITQQDGEWRLTPAGYPAACDVLRREAYLPDPYIT